MKDFFRSELYKFNKEIQLIHDKIAILAGYGHIIINELIIDGIGFRILRDITDSYGNAKFFDRSELLGYKDSGKKLILIEALPLKKNIISDNKYQITGEEIKFKLTRAADTIIDGGIILKIDGTTYDPVAKTRQKT